MTKTIKKLTMVTLLITMFSTFAYGCDNDKPGNKETEAPTTTKVVETTTEKEVTTQEPTTAEPTTQEPTTEEPSTEYVYKGKKFIIESSKKDLFVDLVVEKGYKFKVNDFVDESADDVIRGIRAFDLVKALYQKNFDKTVEFEEKYFQPGDTVILISHSQNVVIEYDEDIKLCFYLVEDNGEKAYFDVYEID